MSMPTNATRSAIRIGLGRGWTEFRQSLTGADAYSFHVLLAAIVLTVLWFQRDHAMPGTSLPLASLALPGLVGVLIAFNTTLTAALIVSTEREDGTLLREKSAPHGMVGYVSGLVVRIPLGTILGLAFVLVPGLFLFPGLASAGVTGWLTLIWVLVLGLLATLPLGLCFGALITNPRSAGQIGLFSAVLVAISGIFYPITGMPGWLHPIAQVFPYYWLGLGMRSALLPAQAAHVELAGSWQHLPTVGVLAAWAVLGLALSPVMLRIMARRASGSNVAIGRQRAEQRVG